MNLKQWEDQSSFVNNIDEAKSNGIVVNLSYQAKPINFGIKQEL